MIFLLYGPDFKLHISDLTKGSLQFKSLLWGGNGTNMILNPKLSPAHKQRGVWISCIANITCYRWGVQWLVLIKLNKLKCLYKTTIISPQEYGFLLLSHFKSHTVRKLIIKYSSFSKTNEMYMSFCGLSSVWKCTLLYNWR